MSEVHIDVDSMVQELKKYKRKEKRYFLFIVGCVPLVVIVSFIIFKMDNPLLFMIGVPIAVVSFNVMLLIGLMRISRSGQDLLNTYKKVVVWPVVKATLPGASYLPEHGFSRAEYESMHLKKCMCTQYQSEDFVKGICKGVVFRQADIQIVRSKNKSGIVYELNGQLREFEIEKPIIGTVLLGKHGSDLDVQPGMKKVELENVKFNQMYDVYAEDAHSVFYVLTPHFMEYLMSLNAWDNEIFMSFDCDKLRLLNSGRGGVFNWNGEVNQYNVSQHIKSIQADLKQIEEVIDILHIENV